MYDARIPAHLFRALSVAEQVRVVALLPNEDKVRGGHEARHEDAALGRARKRVGRDAEPTGVIGAVVLAPEFLLSCELDILDDCRSWAWSFRFHARKGRESRGPGRD